MCRTVTLITEFKLLNRMEKIYRLYPLIHYGDICRFWIDISKLSICQNFRYWSGRYDTIRYMDIETIYRYFRYIDPSLVRTCLFCSQVSVLVTFQQRTVSFSVSGDDGVGAMEEFNKRISSSLLSQIRQGHSYLCESCWRQTEAELYVRFGFCSVTKNYSLVEATSRCSSRTLSTISNRYWTADIYRKS